MKKFFADFLNEQEGQGMAEYALVLGVIAVGVVALLVTFGETIRDKFDEVINQFKGEAEVDSTINNG